MKRTFMENADAYHIYASNKCNAHFRIAERNRLRHRRFGIVVTTLSALVGTSAISSLAKHALSTSQPNQADASITWLQIIAVLLSVIAVVFSSLQTFLSFAETAAQHKAAGAKYGAVRRTIELLVMKYPTAAGEPTDTSTAQLESVKITLDKLGEDSPTIPDRDYDAVVRQRKPEKQEGIFKKAADIPG